MASRQEEKERRREARLAAERAAAAAAARQRRIRIAGAAIVAVAAIVVVVIAIGSSGGTSHAGPSKQELAGVKLPAAKEKNLKKAAAAAGCKLLDYSAEYSPAGQPGGVYSHVAGKVDYATNPPSYGNHNPVPSSDGDYVGQGTPAKENLVHALEHGRIEYQYKPGTPAVETKQLEKLFAESSGQWGSGQLVLLFENQTKMPFQVAAVAWAHILGCPTFNPRIFDAFRDFRATYTFQGPEKLAPQGE